MTSKLFMTIAELSFAQLLLGALSVLVVSIVTPIVYDAHVGPLSKFPGPFQFFEAGNTRIMSHFTRSTGTSYE